MHKTYTLLALVLAMLCIPSVQASTDQYSTGPGTGAPDGMCDVWQALYNAWGLSADLDEDEDGCSNRVESLAGTDPRATGDCLKVGSIIISSSNVIFTFDAEAGKKYRVLSDISPAGAFTTVEIQLAPVNGETEYVPSANAANQAISVAKGSGALRFYRLEVTDVDSDNDGVSDWAERKTGFNPLLADSDGDGVSDADEIEAEVSVPDVVSIEARDSLALEDGPQAGSFVIKRTRSLLPVTANYSLSGTATVGNDFTYAPMGSVALAAGEKEATVYVNPIADATVEGSESVTATLGAVTTTEYTPPVVDPDNNQATVIIQSSTVAAGSGLTARYYDNSNSNLFHAANFGDLGNYTYVRTGTGSPNTGTITIPFTKSPAPQVGNLVHVTFNGGNLNNAAYNHMDYAVSAVTPGVSFVLAISAASLPTNSNSTCYFSIQSYPHPAVIERVDATVDNEWMGGTPNGNSISPSNSPDNWSSVWEGYLAPSTASTSGYRFQLDADDKARVLIDLNRNGTFELPGEQVIEHGWDGPATVGTFNISSFYSLDVPTVVAERYKIRVEHVETTGEARCRLQWSVNGGTFANIPQANVFSHVAAMNANYNYTRTVTTAGAMEGTILVTLNSHGLAVNDSVNLAFSSGNLFTPANGNFHGTFTISAVNSANTFTVPIAAASLPASGVGAGYVLDRAAAPNPTNAWYNVVWQNTTFSGAPGRIGTNNNGTNDSNNGLYGTGTPDVALIGADTFSVRWTGQVQPQFSEDYTFVVHADDGCVLRINDVVQELRTATSTNQGGSTYSYNATTGDLTVSYPSLVVKPDSFQVGEPVRIDPSSGNLTHANGSTYTYDNATGNAVIDYSNLTNITPGSIVAGDKVELDPTNGSATSLSLFPYPVTASTASTFTVNFGPGLFDSGSGSVNFSDNRNEIITAATATSFTVNIGAGKYANSSTGNINVDIVNRPLKDWSSMGNERYVRLPVIAGTRYNIQLDYYENGGFSRCKLYWYSSSQPKQIIPADRLYPETSPVAPPSQVSPIDATGVVGVDLTYNIEGTNGGTVSVSGNPPWLTYSNGVLSGTPPPGSAGDYQVIITITNDDGTSTSVVNVHVEGTGGSVVRELWTGVSGTAVSDFDTNTPPTSTSNLGSLLAPTDAADNYGARIRGYITAPETGNYYFWISASNAAELWISNDSETVNSFKRAAVTAGTAPQQWDAESGQRTPWLALVGGQRYYFEVLHKAGVGSDHLAVGWSRPGESSSVPAQIVPGQVLSPYVAPPPGSTPGTLYVATLLSQSGAITNGVGTATMRVSEDESVAYVKFSYSGLTGPLTDWHVHSDPYLAQNSMIIYDGVEPVTPGDGPQLDGSHKWTILGVGGHTAADVRELIKQGKAYINLHTGLYPNGEIRGNFTLAGGSRTFTPPPPPPAWTDDSGTNSGAARFLIQASYGPNPTDIKALKDIVPTGGKTRYEMWIEDQFTKAPSEHLPEVIRTELTSAQGGNFEETLSFNAWWWRSITGPDQLRQRIAFALSEILVVSGQGPLDNNAPAISYYYDRLAANAFGNFRDILETVTLTPSMGRYLDMLRNDRPDQTVGRIPNENYAREIKQLFSIGLYRMWPDGTLILNSKDEPVDTYSQREIVGFAHVFTGWDYGYDGPVRTSFSAPTSWVRQMRVVPARHYTGPKRILNNEVLPGLSAVGNFPLDPLSVHNSSLYLSPSYEALPDDELGKAHDQLAAHPNVGPFICRQLIQRLVTSSPSRDYVYRVVSKFNDNGSGVRGDMQAVIKAILLDYEARSTVEMSRPAFGKQREPVLRIAAAARAFRPDPFSGTFTQNGNRTITITTTTPHRLVNNNQVFLDFSNSTGGPAPHIGNYAVGGATTSTFTVQATGWATGTYSIPANSSVCTVTMSNHWLQSGHQVFVDFTSGAANSVPDLDQKVYTLTSATPETGAGNFTFDITSGTSTSPRSGNMMIPRFSPGSYTTSSSGLPAPNDRRVTMDTTTAHHLNVGDLVQINFFGGNPQPVDMVATVDSVVDLNTWTFLAPSAGTNLGQNQGNNSVYQFPLVSQPLVRSGDVGSRPSTFNMGNTDADLEQSPINPDTVFNYFLPDYKYPGPLASQGITTPEFQLTAETTVIRQANFIYNGIFNPGNTNGLSSFKTGNNSLVLDYGNWSGGWYGNAVSTAGTVGGALGAGSNTAKPWCNNENISIFIDRLNVLLTGGQIPINVKSVIQNYVARKITNISTGNPCTITTSGDHGFTSGDSVVLSGVTDGTLTPTLNSNSTAMTVTVTGTNTFTLPVNCTVAPTSGGLTNAHVSTIPYNNNTPTDTHKRDRIRTILQLILTSPDFTIQR